MSSIARKQRRSLQRKLLVEDLKNEDTRKVLDVMSETMTADAMLKEIMPKFKADVRERTITTVMVFQLAMLRCDYGFGYERLKKFHRNFLHFAADMKENRTPTRMLVDLLKDECGYDFEKETELIDKELTAYEEKRKKELSA